MKFYRVAYIDDEGTKTFWNGKESTYSCFTLDEDKAYLQANPKKLKTKIKRKRAAETRYGSYYTLKIDDSFIEVVDVVVQETISLGAIDGLPNLLEFD